MGKKTYRFEVTIYEANDEFWESIADKYGCDEVHELLKDALAAVGLFDPENCKIELFNFDRGIDNE